MGTLKPLLQSRNCAYTKWLASRKGDDLVRFKQAWVIARGNQSCKEQLVPGKSRRGREGREGTFWRKESLEMHQGHAAWMLRTVTIKGYGDPGLEQ